MKKIYRLEVWILLRHLLEGSCEIAVRMRTSVRYVARTSRLRLWQLMKNRGFFPFFVQFVVCTRLSQSVTASEKHFESSSSRKKPYYCCEIRRFSQRKVDLVLVVATRLDRKMPNDTTAQKSKNKGRVVRQSVNANPRLKVNLCIDFSSIKMFLTAKVLCSLRLFKLKTEGQTI